jgi:3-keto-5-aminohexanoate cleavage enzyme
MTAVAPSPPNLWDAARREMEEYQLAAEAELQPKWDIPEQIGIHTAISGRMGVGPTALEEFVADASKVIEAGAAAVHFDYSWVQDPTGRRLDREITPVEAYRSVIDPLRERYGTGFVVDCNVLNGSTFDECMAPVREGIAELAPCAPGHPEEFMVPAIAAIEEAGAKPFLAIHSSGEIELAKRKLVDTGILKLPAYWGILYGLPFNTGRTLVSGTWLPNPRDMALHLFLMVDQIKRIDPEGQILVCAAGRATLYMTTLATMLGLHIRVGTEDTVWKYPNSDERASGNLELIKMAMQIAELHGRRPATADEYRQMLGLKTPALR